MSREDGGGFPDRRIRVCKAAGLKGAWHKCRTQNSEWLEYRGQGKSLWGEIREV